MQIAFLIFYLVSSRLVTLIDFINSPIQFYNIIVLTVYFKFVTFCFPNCSYIFPDMYHYICNLDIITGGENDNQEYVNPAQAVISTLM